jgi:hypothetical protein
MGMAILIVVAVMTCHYYRGENAAIRIHDCLDSSVPSSAILAKSDQLYCTGNPVYEPELGGIPRNCLTSKCYLPILPY